MFRPEGKFSAVLCPLGAGVDCSRPHCFFKHAKGSDNTLSEDKPSESSKVTRRVSAEGRKQDTKGQDNVTISKKAHIPTINIPQYRPTPLATLQKRQEAQSRHRSGTVKKLADKKIATISTEIVHVDEELVGEFSDDEDEEAILQEIFQEEDAVEPEARENGGKLNHKDVENDEVNEKKEKDPTDSSAKRKREERSSRSKSSGRSESSSSSSRKKHRKSSSSKDSGRERSDRSSSDGHRSDRHSKSSSHRNESKKSDDSKSSRHKDSSKGRTSPETTNSEAAKSEDGTHQIALPNFIEAPVYIPRSESNRDAVTGNDLSFLLSDDEQDDDDETEQLLELFEESQSVPLKPKEIINEDQTVRAPSNVVEMVGTTKKRVAHDPLLRAEPVVKKRVHLSPSQQLALRLQAVANAQKSNEKPSLPTLIDKKRIAHVSTNLVKAVAAKNNLTVKAAPVTPASANPTLANQYRKFLEPPQPHATNHVQQKGISRVAHASKPVAPPANTAAPPRPRIAYDPKARVPLNIRQMFLERFIDANNQLSNTYEESYEKSLEEEKALCQRSKDRRLYMSLVANHLLKLKKQSGEIQQNKNSNSMSHADILDGVKAKKLSFSIEKRSAQRQALAETITEEQFYEHLRENYLMSQQQLETMGFPRTHPKEAGFAVFLDERSKTTKQTSTKTKKLCCRCKKEYELNEDGSYVKIEQCSYHWGKNWTRKVLKGNLREQQYTCCDAESGSEGCCVAPGHVSDSLIVTEDSGYCTTLNLGQSQASKKVYALDCEMIYTSRGTELARVTVVDMNMKSIYETNVVPQNKVLDYNTRFSGLKAEDLAGCTTSIYDVQAVLLSLFPADCILVGHSLESDLKALKLIHSTVVDTSMVFPHKLGLPYKRALKNLLKEYCQKIIQDGVDGHDSAEDARACMELLLFKVKQDLKSR